MTTTAKREIMFHYEKEPITDINKLIKGNQFDLHSWVEYDDGTIDDYDDISLSKISMFGSLDIVRVPFSLELTLKVLPHIKKHLDTNLWVISELEDKELMKEVNRIMNKPGACIYRSYLIKAKLLKQGRKCKIVYGSLGFRQPDGSVFYEYG